MIAHDDKPDKYEQWCCNLVIHETVEYYKLHDNEGVVIYKEGDIDSSDGEGDNLCHDCLCMVVVVII